MAIARAVGCMVIVGSLLCGCMSKNVVVLQNLRHRALSVPFDGRDVKLHEVARATIRSGAGTNWLIWESTAVA